ncbi:MAG: Na+/H+ antiporter NhaC family protein [Fusicatenibacter sp.]
MSNGLIAIFIILVIIVGAIATRRCMEFLLGGSLIAAIFLYGKDFLGEWCVLLQNVLAENVWIVLVCGLFGSLIALLQESKGTFGFAKLISKFCNTERKTLLTTFIMGVLIFVDDYLNVLSIGVCMKNVYDKRKIPRETLAYMLDATGAPVCVLLPFSTWAVFYASLFAEQESVKALGYATGIQAYIRAIPFCFYPIITLIIVVLFALGIMPKLGAMKKAYQRVEETGKVYSDASRKYNHSDRIGYEEEGNIWNFVIPMVVLVAIAIATSDLLLAVVVSLLVCYFLYVPRKVMSTDEFFNLVIKGFADMLPILTLLVIAFVLQKVTEGLGMTEFIIEIMEPLLKGSWFPAIAFVLVAALTFCTGSLWGMSAVVAPIVFPLGAAIGANPILIMAAIISGGAFGSHACFYTDATLLSSTSAGIDNIEHALSQLPYVIIACVLSVIAFLICGFVI